MRLRVRKLRSIVLIGTAALSLFAIPAAVAGAGISPESTTLQVAPPACDGTTPTDPVRDARVPAPFRDVDGRSNAGAVEVRMANGTPSFLLVSPSPQANERFGTAVFNTYVDGTANPASGEVGVIGAPGLTVNGKSNAGGIYLYRHVGPDICSVGLFTQDHPDVPGSAQAGARFGTALVGSGRVGNTTAPMTILVGTPGRTVNGQKAAGAVVQLDLTWSADVPTIAGTTHTASTVRVPRTNDQLGQVLLSTGPRWYAGAPGATVKGIQGAGLVLSAPFGGAPDTLWHQGDGRVGDKPGKDDAFGSSITVVGSSIWVGAPGEDVNGQANAGMVNGLHDGSVYHQDSNDGAGNPVDDRAEAGDRFGYSVMVDRTATRLMVGVPGEDLEGNVDAGFVNGLLGATSETGATTGGQVSPGDELGASSAYSTRNDVFVYGLPGSNGGQGSLATKADETWERWTMREPQAGERFASSLARNVTLY